MLTVYLGGFGLTFVVAFVLVCIDARTTPAPQGSESLAAFELVWQCLAAAALWPVTVPGLILIEIIKRQFGRAVPWMWNPLDWPLVEGMTTGIAWICGKRYRTEVRVHPLSGRPVPCCFPLPDFSRVPSVPSAHNDTDDNDAASRATDHESTPS